MFSRGIPLLNYVNTYDSFFDVGCNKNSKNNLCIKQQADFNQIERCKNTVNLSSILIIWPIDLIQHIWVLANIKKGKYQNPILLDKVINSSLLSELECTDFLFRIHC